MDWTAVWPNLIANLIALIAGIPIGLWVDRFVRQRNTREETNAHVQSIANELAMNRKIVANIASVLRDETNKGRLPIPNVLLTAWSTAKQQGFIQSYKDSKSLATLLVIYRDLEEIEIRIEQLWRLVASGMSVVGDTGPQFRLLADRATDLAIKVEPKIQNLFQKWRVKTQD